jgi:hypothetical protein
LSFHNIEYMIQVQAHEVGFMDRLKKGEKNKSVSVISKFLSLESGNKETE